MSRTPEELGKLSQQFIEDYFGPEGGSFDEEVVAETSFLAGYKAAQPQWISVKDRLPDEDGEMVLASDGTRRVTANFFHDGQRFYFYNPHMEIVTHWMPLPKAPEE